MALNLKKTHINDVVSKKEFHLDLEKDFTSIYIISDINEKGIITAHGCNFITEEKFIANDLYILHPGANVVQYIKDHKTYMEASGVAGNISISSGTTGTLTYINTDDGSISFMDSSNNWHNINSVDIDGKIKILWSPQREITVLELALCIPWIINPFIDPNSPTRYQPHFKHFKFQDDEEFEHLFEKN